MAEENRAQKGVPTREECRRCVEETRGKLNEQGKDLAIAMIEELLKERNCEKEGYECALKALAEKEPKAPEVNNHEI